MRSFIGRGSAQGQTESARGAYFTYVKFFKAPIAVGSPGAHTAPLETHDMYKTLRIDKQDRVWRVVLNRPELRIRHRGDSGCIGHA